jgi:TolA-binding protein
MKTNHLLTFCVLSALTSFGVLLTDGSSIAQNLNVPAPSRNPRDPKPSTSNDVVPVPSPTVTNNPSAVSVASTSSSTIGSVSPLSIIAGILHSLEIAGIAWAYFRIFKKNNDEINELKEKLTASEKRQKTQEDNLKFFASNTVDAQKLILRINAIEQVAHQQRSSAASNIGTDHNPLPSPEPFKAADNIPSQYPFLDIYRQNPEIFKNQYVPEIVSEDAENLQKRRSGDYQEIILGKDRQGNYWLFNDGYTTYLIPSPKLKVNDLNIGTAGWLFTCENYTPGYQNMAIVRPAIVSSQLGTNERWKLEQKGILEFM